MRKELKTAVSNYKELSKIESLIEIEYQKKSHFDDSGNLLRQIRDKYLPGERYEELTGDKNRNKRYLKLNNELLKSAKVYRRDDNIKIKDIYGAGFKIIKDDQTKYIIFISAFNPKTLFVDLYYVTKDKYFSFVKKAIIKSGFKIISKSERKELNENKNWYKVFGLLEDMLYPDKDLVDFGIIDKTNYTNKNTIKNFYKKHQKILYQFWTPDDGFIVFTYLTFRNYFESLKIFTGKIKILIRKLINEKIDILDLKEYINVIESEFNKKKTYTANKKQKKALKILNNHYKKIIFNAKSINQKNIKIKTKTIIDNCNKILSFKNKH